MKTSKLSTSRLKQLLQKNNWNSFISQFNRVHNKHLSSNVGNVEIKINDKKKINK